jgi:hypothetical protein
LARKVTQPPRAYWGGQLPASCKTKARIPWQALERWLPSQGFREVYVCRSDFHQKQWLSTYRSCSSRTVGMRRDHSSFTLQRPAMPFSKHRPAHTLLDRWDSSRALLRTGTFLSQTMHVRERSRVHVCTLSRVLPGFKKLVFHPAGMTRCRTVDASLRLLKILRM